MFHSHSFRDSADRYIVSARIDEDGRLDVVFTSRGERAMRRILARLRRFDPTIDELQRLN